MVQRNLTIPHDFYCITDDPTGLDDGIIVRPLLDTAIPGNGRKLRTFSADFLGLEGQYVVSLDIDLVIVSNIDFLADEPEKEFVIARHPRTREIGVRNHGAVYRLKVGSRREVWDRFIADPDGAAGQCPAYGPPPPNGAPRPISEQRWLDHVLDEIDYLPEGKVVSFSHDCDSRAYRLFGKTGVKLGLTTAYFGEARPPRGAAIISFHGPTLPHHVRDKSHGRWRRAPFVAEHWVK